MEDIERQRELTMVSRGVDRFFTHRDKLEGQGKQWDAAPNSGLLSEMVEALIPGIEHVQTVARNKFVATLTTGGRHAGWELDVLAIHPAILAYITVRTLLTRTGSSRHVLISQIGATINMEIQFDRMRTEERFLAKKESRRNRIENLKRTVKEVGPRTVRKWIKKLDDLEKVEWDYSMRMTVGMLMFEAATLRLQDYLDIQMHTKVGGRGQASRKVVSAHLNEATKARVQGRIEELSNASPWLVPMVCLPEDWTEEDLGDDNYRYSGGYLAIKKPIIKGEDNFDNIHQKGTWVTKEILDAVNAIQKTKWRVNAVVLETAKAAYEEGRVEILPVEPVKTFPPTIADEVWEKMSREERGKLKNDRRAIHDHNNRLEAKRESMRRCLAVAEDHVLFEYITFPHNMDFRGRIYPLPQDLHPQADDFARGLLEFSEGKKLGESGLRWLCHAVAGAYGEDKLSLDQQVDWCMENMVSLSLVSRDPLGDGYRFLTKAEEPWQFLAAALELEEALTQGVNNFVSHLPVSVDGTCNGLQHLSALGRDPIGAKATNLIRGDRQDIYQIVADKVTRQVNLDIREGSEQALAWDMKVSRKTVKRGVMTTPYGVTPEGIRAQLIADRLCDDLEGDKLKNASYMRDQMLEAIDGTVIMGRAVMQWMQLLATELATQGKPATWVSPVGLRCVQEYRTPRKRRMQTLLGQTEILHPNRKGEIRKAKQRNSIAPNIVHSYDAAHLMKTVNACAQDGLTAFGVVHDSFGTHACDVDKLSYHLRDQFIEIYSVDWLDVMAESFGYQLESKEDWIQPPPKGNFDLEEVRASRYFFF